MYVLSLSPEIHYTILYTIYTPYTILYTVKCTKGVKEHTFFTIPEYNNWRAANRDGVGYKIKYYKGN